MGDIRDEKFITLPRLELFKELYDSKLAGLEVPTFIPEEFKIELDNLEFTCRLSSSDVQSVIEHKYQRINIQVSEYSITLSFMLANILQDGNEKECSYSNILDAEGVNYKFLLDFMEGEIINKSSMMALGGGAELDYATDSDIDALFGIQSTPTMWNVMYNLTGCSQGSGAETQVADGGLLQFSLHSSYSNYEWQSVIITMGGVDITSTAWNEGNEKVLISHVTGDVVITAICVEVQPEDIPVESIEFVNLPTDDSIELNVGDVVDMSQYIEVHPANATDKSYTLTTDAPSVLSINGTTITVLQGSEGLNANLTVTANDGSGCYNIMIVDILDGGDEPEEDVHIESIRYTDGSGNTCVGFNMLLGETVDLWTNLEILPDNYTDGVEFISDDDGIIQVDSGGMATATGEVGDSTTITISSMENPNIFTTVNISIAEEEPEEEEGE